MSWIAVYPAQVAADVVDKAKLEVERKRLQDLETAAAQARTAFNTLEEAMTASEKKSTEWDGKQKEGEVTKEAKHKKTKERKATSIKGDQSEKKDKKDGGGCCANQG